MNGAFHKDNFFLHCDTLAASDEDLRKILLDHGYPPCWTRKPNFETLTRIILEQQVSLASAKAAFLKLKEKVGNITPKKVLALTDAQLKSCFFSRQKTVYLKGLAAAILSKKLDLKKLNNSPEELLRTELKKMKGIGDWTVDIYLIMALQRPDIFPTGDLALVNSFKKLKKLPADTLHEEIIARAEKWRPYRSIATMMLWHLYIKERKITL